VRACKLVWLFSNLRSLKHTLHPAKHTLHPAKHTLHPAKHTRALE